jgi:hypothetical protein
MAEAPTVRDGFMHLPDVPGFALSLRAESIEKWRAR